MRSERIAGAKDAFDGCEEGEVMNHRCEFRIHLAHERSAVSLACFDTATDWAVASVGFSVVGRLREAAWAVWSLFGATSIALTRMKELSIGTFRDSPVASAHIAADQTHRGGRVQHVRRAGACHLRTPARPSARYMGQGSGGLDSVVRRRAMDVGNGPSGHRRCTSVVSRWSRDDEPTITGRSPSATAQFPIAADQ